MEGRLMHHCVGGYVQQAQSGCSFFYKVLKPQRGTLQLSITGEKVIIDQFKLACNEMLSEKSQFSVRQWLTDDKENGRFNEPITDICNEQKNNEKVRKNTNIKLICIIMSTKY
jgi:hypothetical protein